MRARSKGTRAEAATCETRSALRDARDFLANPPQVAWAGIAVGPAHRSEEQAIDRPSGEAGEPGVGVATGQAESGGRRLVL
jgi:hypothetical protein